MSNELRLPPHREMPPEVRARLRRRVWNEVRPGRLQMRRTAPALAAAAVAVALVGGVIFVGSRDHDDNAPVAAGTVTKVNRCWNAITHAHKQSHYPERSKWRAELAETGGIHGVDMLAIRAGDKALFCGLTPTTVRISAPVSPASTEVRPILAIPNGPIGGLWNGNDAAQVDVQHHGKLWYGGRPKLTTDDELFTLRGPMTSTTRLYRDDVDPTYRKPKNRLPEPPAAMIERVDHPERQGSGDAQGRRRLGQCAPDATPEPLPTPFDTLTPKAMTAHSLLATKGRAYLLCFDDYAALENRAAKTRPTKERPVLVQAHVERGAKHGGGTLSMRSTLAGDVHPSVSRLTFTNHGRTVSATVDKGTFLVDMPLTIHSKDEQAFNEGHWALPATAYDSDGKVIFKGVLRPGPS